MTKKRCRKAFTIVELVIVIAVIAVLAAVLIPTFGNVIEKAKDASAMQEARNAYTEYVSKNAAADSEYLIHEADGRYVALHSGGAVGVYESKREAIWALGAIFESNASAAPNGEKLKICYTVKESLKNKKISILGDSISTFKGVSNNTEHNSTIGLNWNYYPISTSGVDLDATWWKQTIKNLKLQLVVNNSWSGSCIHKKLYDNGTVGAYVDRCVQLHNDHTGVEPDIIAVYLGTNDYDKKQELGTAEGINYGKLIEKADKNIEPDNAVEAYVIMLYKSMMRYPNADFYCFTLLPRENLGDSDPRPANLEGLNASIAAVAEHFGATVVDLYNDTGINADNFKHYITDGEGLHPGPFGMDAITDCFTSALLNSGNYDVSTVYKVDYELDGVIVNEGMAKAVQGGESFSFSFKEAPTTVTVTMGGEEVEVSPDQNGKYTIENVTGDIVITASGHIHSYSSTVTAPTCNNNGYTTYSCSCSYSYTDNIVSATGEHSYENGVCSTCNRRVKKYRWEFNGTELVSATKECTVNTLERLEGSVTNEDVHTKSRYKLSESVVLHHSRTWSVEWKSSGKWTGEGAGALLFSNTEKNTALNNTYLYRRQNNDLIGIGYYDGKTFHNYCVYLKDKGIVCSDEHTYRLENRIADNGSNMVYLLIDGNEIGALVQYSPNGGQSDITGNWISGKNFVWNYLGATNHHINDCKIGYIAVNE